MKIDLQPAKTAEEKHSVMLLLQANHLPTEDIGDRTRLFALRKGKELLGSGGLEYYGKAALLRSVCVAEKGRGYGKYITEQLERIAQADEMEEIILLTTTARDFFAKMNYELIQRGQVPEPVQRSAEFASVCPATAAVMRKTLKTAI